MTYSTEDLAGVGGLSPFSSDGAPAPSTLPHGELGSQSCGQGALPGENVRLISNSEVQAFKRCRRKWALQREGWNLAEQEVTGPLPFGTAIHGALEWYYGHSGDPLEWWARHCAEAYDLEDKKQEKDARLGRVMLEGYLDWVAETGVDEGLEVVQAERFVTVRFGNFFGTEVHLTGRLDVKVYDDKTKETTFLDHKTCQNLEPDPHRSEQLLTYDLIDSFESGKHTLTGGKLNKLRKVLRTGTAVPPFYDRQPQYHTEADLLRFKERLVETIMQMLQYEERLTEANLPVVGLPTHDRSCSWWCKEFIVPCRMMDDGASYRTYLSDLYTKDPSDYEAKKRRDWLEATA